MSRSAVAALLFAAACYRSAHDPALVARIDTLEQRLAQIEKHPASAELAMSAAEMQLHNDILKAKVDTLTKQVEILENKLLTQAARPTPPPLVRRRVPDPAATYAVPVGRSPVLGFPKAKVTIVMAFEFACPYCHKAWATMDELRKKYGKELRVVYKQYIVHPTTATAAAQLSCAANKQGRWRETADLLWDKAFLARQFDQATMDAIALEVGLEPKQYQADIAGSCVQDVKDEHDMLHKLGVGATPVFYVNGRYMSGARPIEEFQKLVDEELAKATALVKKGVRPERLYDQEIVRKGIAEIPLPP